MDDECIVPLEQPFKLLTQFVQDNNFKAVKRLIDEVPVNHFFEKIVFLTITLERKQIFPLLLRKKNIDFNVLNGSGETFLHASLKCSDDFFLKKLLKRGIPLDRHIYKTILHNAVALNKPNFVKNLLQCGVIMNNEDIMGMTPLDIAIENKNMEIVSMLLYYNCDTYPKNGNVSPFMYSMLSDSDVEIQLLLLRYEVDINNSDLLKNNLFIAIESCNYLIAPIIEYGADVNQICNNTNIIQFILEHPISTEIFKIIWERFDCKIWELTIGESILEAIVNNSSLPDNLWIGYIRTIIESDKIREVLEKQNSFLITSFVEQCTRRNYKERDFYDLVCILLSNGCRVYPIDIHKVYNSLGTASKVLKILVHMDTERGPSVDFNFIRVRYSFDTSVNQLLHNLIFNMKIFNMTASYKDILRFFTIPRQLRDHMENQQSVNIPFQVTWNNVPTLVELSRNASRDYICQRFNIHTGSRYYSLLNHSSIPNVIKELLAFERPLYYHE